MSSTRIRNAAVVLLFASACGSDVPSNFPPKDQYAQRCVTPRKGTNPYTGEDYPDRQGKLLDEQLWLRSWTDELYLWYDEVEQKDPKAYASTDDYFAELKTKAMDANGKPKDRFHFSEETDAWRSSSLDGIELGYGIQWLLEKSAPPRKLLVAYVQPDSEAADAGVTRGAEILRVDGELVETSSEVDTLNSGLFPKKEGKHRFQIRNRGQLARTVKLTAAPLTLTPVTNVKTMLVDDRKIGYFVFNEHIATAEPELVAAINQLNNSGATDVIVDLRYNSGGSISIASQLAYMLAGPKATEGKFFELQKFNDKWTTEHPISRKPIKPYPFVTKTLPLDDSKGVALPFIKSSTGEGLKRVVVLTSASTCSASEALMNGLSGIGVEVIQIGQTTCGKPYGFYPADNCGTTYFSIQFLGVNYQGLADYLHGFAPNGIFNGCVVNDDLTHNLGELEEAQLATALAYLKTGTCPSSSKLTAAGSLSNIEGQVIRSSARWEKIGDR